MGESIMCSQIICASIKLASSISDLFCSQSLMLDPLCIQPLPPHLAFLVPCEIVGPDFIKAQQHGWRGRT
jgi:hypothetical protein